MFCASLLQSIYIEVCRRQNSLVVSRQQEGVDGADQSKQLKNEKK